MTPARPDKSTPPSDAQLAELLGRAKPAWDELVRELSTTLDGATIAWKLYAGVHGWQLKAERKRKALLYLMPKPGLFVAATALSDAAVQQLDEAGLPDALVAAIRAGKRFAEGTPARVEVRNRRQLASVRRLVRHRLAHP